MALAALAAACTQPGTPALTPREGTDMVRVVSGYVVGGGDTTPGGLADAPRKFVYQVQQDDGSVVNVAYTAYPPGPTGDQARKKIRLDFHAGTIRTGDYLEARGRYDEDTNTVVVADEGDYIETYSQKP
jgi:hypothetical protein